MVSEQSFRKRWEETGCKFAICDQDRHSTPAEKNDSLTHYEFNTRAGTLRKNISVILDRSRI
jgi:hypothetical protein